MKFESVNEPMQLGFDDCVMHFIKSGEDVLIEAEALIIKAYNSQNQNYTDSYADTSELLFKKGRIQSIVREGYKQYDAMDRLVHETMDETIKEEDYDKVMKEFQNAYLFSLCQKENEYMLRIEIPMEEDSPKPCNDTYEISIIADAFKVSFDRFLNRVQY